MSGQLPPLSKFQGFKVVRIDRRQIKNADYNPRTISPATRRKLRRSLERFKLVETLVWNVRTGNLVGGHQRIGEIDALEGTDAYSLDVSQIDVDIETEKALNIALNNPELQGQYDIDLLASVVKDVLDTSPKLVEDAGVDRSNLAMWFGDDFLTPAAAQQAAVEAPIVEELNAMYEAGSETRRAAPPSVQQPSPSLQSANQPPPPEDDESRQYGEKGWTKQDFRDRRAEFKGQKTLLDEANCYLTLSFDSTAQLGDFLERYGFNPELRSIDASQLLGTLGIELEPIAPDGRLRVDVEDEEFLARQAAGDDTYDTDDDDAALP